VARCLDEFKDVVVVEVKVEHNCSIFVDASTSELLVKAAIDFAKRDWAASNKSFAVVNSCGAEFAEMDCNASSIS
jgi:hypothetical protein